jgi:hypothetical protein
MAFLDNSGDIILDAVLTDVGRRRLARGDGSFKIAKFALGDDEINYRLYNPSHASGSAYYDLEILQSPVLEAFTDPEAQMHHRLISLRRNDLLYLPILELFESGDSTRHTGTNSFLVAVDTDTEDALGDLGGLIYGAEVGSVLSSFVQIDQGVDANGVLAVSALSGDLLETQYQVELDNRFGSIYNSGGSRARVSFVNEHSMASYYVGLGTDATYVSRITDLSAGASSINGRRGTRLSFKIGASLDLNGSTSLFTKFGGTSTITAADASSVSVYHIDSVARVTGVTTGYSIDIPIRFVKKV